MGTMKRLSWTACYASAAVFGLFLGCGSQSKTAGIDEHGAPIRPECDPERCGPQLGMPNYVCADGSIAGPTGRCLLNENRTCGWEVVDCPDACAGRGCDQPPQPGPGPGPGPRPDPSDPCEREECVPAMLAPNFECNDGTIGGPRCVRGRDGQCGWVYVDCPARCDAFPCDDARGEGDPARTDGSGNVDPSGDGDPTDGNDGRTGDGDGDGSDQDPTDPPQRDCAEGECGPQLGMPNYSCGNGTVGGPTGRCLRQPAGNCAWEIRQCVR